MTTKKTLTIKDEAKPDKVEMVVEDEPKESKKAGKSYSITALPREGHAGALLPNKALLLTGQTFVTEDKDFADKAKATGFFSVEEV